MIIKRNKVNFVKKMKIIERKISFKRIEPWIPQARAATKRGFLDRTSSNQTRLPRSHEQQPNASSSSSQTRSRSMHEQKFQQLPRSRAVPATRRGLDRRTSRSSSSFLDREQFQQLPAARAVPAPFGSASSSGNFRQREQFPANRVSVCLLKDLSKIWEQCVCVACSCVLRLIATTSNSLLPVEKLADLTPTFFIGLLKPLVPLLLMHIYGAAVNQVADVEIDKARVLLLL
ncbi:hypothetical protein WN944_019426 [Citrus x changshan-huyou]|uniref:Uncharacterized protein n=1 Tax=Citrus x changshan-huyou TaxID=2935761 RepID=A0AAP0QE02_9ROSI